MIRKPLIMTLISILFSGCLCINGQNQKMDGYKGLWFSIGRINEYGGKVSGGAATFGSQIRPVAVFSPEVRKTFFVYGGTTRADERHLLIMVSYFDHSSHMVPRPVVVYDKMGVIEPHDNAALSIDNAGFLWIFISGRNRTRPGLIFKSSRPYSIESFEMIAEKEMIFPQPWWINDRGFLLMHSRLKNGMEICYSSSTDGRTWSESKKLACMGGSYQVSDVYRNKLVTIFNYHPGGDIDKRTNLYLLQTDDFGKTWKTIENKVVNIPLMNAGNEALVRDFESEGKLVYLSDLNFDREGNPVILVILSRDSNPGPAGGAREWMVINRKDNKWNFSKVCESSHNYDMGSLYITDSVWRIIGPTESGPRKYRTGGEIALWVSRNEGVNWEKECDITLNSTGNNSFVRRPVNTDKDFAALWTDGDPDKFSKSYLYFTDMKCNKVWSFPYEMKREHEKPVRVREF